MLFMVDTETTGLTPATDSLLSLAIVPIVYDNAYKRYIRVHTQTGVARFYELFPYVGEPKDDFAKKHMAALYAKCNKIAEEGKHTAEHTANQAKIFIEKVLDQMRHKEPQFLCLNPMTLDIPMLKKYGIIDEKIYRTLDVNTLTTMAGDIYGLDSYQSRSMCHGLGVIKAGERASKGTAHDAFDDCLYQLEQINGALAMIRGVTLV